MTDKNPRFRSRVGTDIVNVDRIRKAIERHGDLFLKRVFTPGEIERVTGRSGLCASYAARFAAKEAVMKLIGEGIWRIPFTDIEIVSDPSGRPYVILRGKARKYADKGNIGAIDVSLAHERDYAVATASAIVEVE